MAQRLLRVRAFTIGVTALLLFGATNQAPITLAASTPPPAVVQPGPAAAASRNRVPLAISRPPVPITSSDAGGGPVPNGGVGVRVTPGRVTPPSQPTEQTSLRTEMGTVTANPDGTYTSIVSSGRVNFQDSKGAWQPIDVRLVSDVADGYGLRTAANDRTVRVSDTSGQDQLAALVAGAYTVKLRVLGTGAGTVAASRNSVVFQGAGGSGAFAVVPTPEGFEFSVTVAKPNDPNTYRVVLDTGGLAASLAADGQTVLLSDASGKPVGKVSAPTVLDAAGNAAPTLAVAVTIDDPGAGAVMAADGAVVTPPTMAPDEPSADPSPSAAPSPSATPTAATSPTAAPSVEPAPTEVPSPSSGPSSSPSAPSPRPSIAPTPSPAAASSPANVVRPNEVVLTYTIDPVWLTDAARAYPVVLDPTVCIRFDSGASGCNTNLNVPNSRYGEGFTESNFPTLSPTGIIDQIGYDATNGNQYAFYYFGHAALADGAIVTNADFQLYQKYSYGGQHLRTAPIGTAWNHATIAWSNQPGTTGSWTDPVNALTSAGWLHQDVTAIVQARYTRSPLDWKVDYGFTTRLFKSSDWTTCTTGTAECSRIYVDSASEPTASLRPQLAITYYIPQVSIDFDPSLGPDFVPSTMPAGSTVNVPVIVTNNNSAQTFNHNTGSLTDYYQVGWRWFDNKGKYATGFTSSGVADLPADLGPTAPGNVSATISLPVLAPPNPGQYGLRLDLVHVVNGVRLWASDWATPSMYYARNKDSNATGSTTRWTGRSVIKRADFPIAVVAGGGTATGETKSVSLPDGSTVGINTWSHNLTYTGQGGVNFADLGTTVGVSYGYNSADRTDCTGILGACGWWTNYDEGFTKGTNGADYIYRDGGGNKSFINSNGDGQLTGGTGGQIDRPRITLWDENDPGGWTGQSPSMGSTGFSGTHSLQILTANGVALTQAFTPVDLGAYPLVSFAVDGNASGAGVGFYVRDLTTGTNSWLYYTVGTDFAIGTYPHVILGGTFTSTSWRDVNQVNIHADAVTKGIAASTYDTLSVTEVAVRGPSGSATLRFDDVRFEGRTSGQIRDDVPTWSANPSKAARFTGDAHSGAASIQVTNAPVNAAPTHTQTSDISSYAYESWAWKSVGGSSIAIAFTLVDVRDSSRNGTIVYYAGPTAPAGVANCPHTITPCAVQVAAAVPTEWTVVTRNLLEDSRQLLGFFNDADTSGSESAPGGGPTPDQVSLTDYALVAPDGSYGLFDDLFLETLPNIGDHQGDATGDDFVITYRGGAQHRFNADGKLVQLEDADNNPTTVSWTYAYPTRTYTLSKIVAPSDNQTVAGGLLAQREIAVTFPTNAVRFTESLGTTASAPPARYTEFQRTATDLTTVVPARWDAPCGTGASPSGCLLYAYTGSHLLQTITDPRKTSTKVFTTTVGWTGTDPMYIRADATATDQLRILSWNAGSSWATRPKYQDADGIATGTNGFARYDDLTPNGSVLVEYAPVACSAPNCGSAPAPADKLVEYRQDGADDYTTEIHYRLPGNDPAGAVTSRRGTFAAAKVDNFADAITGGLTAWSQTPEQYTASVAQANADLYRTTYAYNPLGLQTHAATPYTNPVGTNNVAVQDVVTAYDPEGHPTEVSDKGFVVNPGFESALVGWTKTGTGTLTADATAPNAGQLSAKLTGTAAVAPTTAPELLPGQAVRFQFAIKAVAGTTISYELDYQRTSDSQWLPLVGLTGDATTSWHTLAFDTSVPLDGNGLVRPTFSIPSGTAYVDDPLLFTSFAKSVYNGNGTPDTAIDILNHTHKLEYAAGTTYPAIFPTTSWATYVNGGFGGAPDENAATTTTYDRWGRPLVVTDPDSVPTITEYDTNMTDVLRVTDGLGKSVTYSNYDAIGERQTTTDQILRPTTTTYGFFGDPLDVTAPDLTITHHEYDGVGRLTSITRNFVNGGAGTTGVNNVKETKAYTEYGKVTTDIVDAGVTDATTTTTYDRQGNVVTSTVYPDGTSNGRTMTTYFDPAGTPAGSAGPIVPTAAPAPACPGAAGSFCNSVSTIDLSGRTIATTDAYGTVTASWFDFGGKPVESIANYRPGQAETADQNVTSTMRYDTAGHIVDATDPLHRPPTSTVYDSLDRVKQVVRPDGSWVRTDYTKSGRVDQTSRPGSSVQGDADVAWTKNVYDLAGRLVTTMANYDRSGNAQLQLIGFESNTAEGAVTSPADAFLVAGATASLTPNGNTGRYGLIVSTTAVQDQGIKLALKGTFQTGHTYKAAIYAKGSATNTTFALQLGNPSGNSATATATASTSWQQLTTAGWTPNVATATAELAFRPSDTSPTATSVTIDDIAVWDVASADRNIPTTTIYDAAGQVTSSIAPPGHAGEPGPVTASAYDPMGRLSSVTVNHDAGLAPAADVNLTTGYTYDAVGNRTDTTDPNGIVTHLEYDRRGNITATTQNYQGAGGASYASTILGDAPTAYWRLGETSGTTAADATGHGHTANYLGGYTLGQTGALSGDSDKATAFNGTDGRANASATYAGLPTGNAARTVEGWAKWTGATVYYSHFLGYGEYTTAHKSFDVGVTTTHGGDLTWDDNSQSVNLTTGTAKQGVFADHGWHYVAVTYDGAGTLKGYVDGTAVNTASVGTLNTTASSGLFLIGVWSNFWSGVVDDVAIYPTALSANQVSTHFTAASAASSATVNVRSTFAYDDLNELLASCPAERVQADGCTPTPSSSSAWRQTYDAAGHTIDAIAPVNTTAQPLVTTTAVYDTAAGGARLTRTCDHPAGASNCTSATRYTDYLYDKVGRQIQATTYQGAPTGVETLRTDTTYDKAGQRTGLATFENGSPSDSLTFDYDDLGRETTVSRGSPITTTVYNADGTVATRTDQAISSTAAGFSYDLLGNLESATSPLYTGSATFTWRLDGLIDTRGWPGTSPANNATFAYDGAKRPTQVTETHGAAAQATLTRTYDRTGSVMSETQTIPDILNYAGNTTQSFGYDPLGRITTASLGTVTRVYTYDADSNRLTANENGTTTYLTYDRTDEITTQKVGVGGTVRAAVYDTYGNATTIPNPDGSATNTTYAHDLGDRLKTQTPASGSGQVTYTIDALGRHGSRTLGSVTDAYTYAGSGPAVVRIANATTATNSAIDALGSRLATKTAPGGIFGWLLPDLHGDISAALTLDGGVVTDAFRYDPYGKLVASTQSSLPTPWRYQGRLLESSGTDPALYDFVFRSYDPGLGAFLSEDDVAGQALNPITFNRFLYASANPETLVDPDGHASCFASADLCDEMMAIRHQQTQAGRDALRRSASRDRAETWSKRAVHAKAPRRAFESNPKTNKPADTCPSSNCPSTVPTGQSAATTDQPSWSDGGGEDTSIARASEAGAAAEAHAPIFRTAGMCQSGSAGFSAYVSISTCWVKDRSGKRAMLITGGAGGIAAIGGGAGYDIYVSNGNVDDQKDFFAVVGMAGGFELGGGVDISWNQDQTVWVGTGHAQVLIKAPPLEFHTGGSWTIVITDDRLTSPPAGSPAAFAFAFADTVFWADDQLRK